MPLDNPICVIPARMGSSRFPGKSLEPLLGHPLVLHVYDRCCLYDQFSEVIVATCDQMIEDQVIAHGGVSVMTSDSHERCTDRVEECVKKRFPDYPDDGLIVMVQGDEVLVSPEMIAAVIDAQRKTNAPVVNLGSRLYQIADQESSDTVKIVAAPNGNVMFFSRSRIPSAARDPDVPVYQQTGVMVFTWKFLKEFSSLPQTPLEKTESVDMLRVLEHGLPLPAVFTEIETLGVDTPADLIEGEARLRADPITSRYLTTPG